jgi:hypothetical protein
MNDGKTVFSQLFEFLPLHDFRKCVRNYRGDYKVLSFSCLDQFLCMAFAQLTFRESLRDIETCLRTVRPKLYHMGIRGGVSRNTLAHANENRDWRIYADFAQILIRTARSLYVNDPFAVELEHTAYALDSTTIDLCLSLFPWARFRKRKAAVKLHTLLDLRGNIPSFIKITDGKRHDVRILDELVPEPGSYYVMDRGYLDFKRLHAFSLRLAFFVIRAKTNLRFRRVDSKPIDKATGVRADQTIVLTGINAAEHYPDKLRRVRFFDVANKKKLVFLTNDFTLPPESIALLYKQRWQVELFFRWIKQHLRIKAFFGTSENAVKTQVWIAISVYVLVAIIKKRLHLKQSLYTILQILSISVFEKEPLFHILTNYERSGLLPEPGNQLNLFN